MDDERSFSYGHGNSVSHKRRSSFQVDNGKHKRQNFSNDLAISKPIDTLYRILCPAKRIGSVLGKGGDIINALRNETHAKIRVADAIPGSEERVIIIFSYLSKESENNDSDPEPEDSYPAEQEREELRPHCPAQDALLKVHDRIIADEYIRGGVVHEKAERDDEDVIARILVPNNQVGCLLGKGGFVIQKLRSETSASIRIFPVEHLPPCAMRTDELVQISGMAPVVKRALYEISSLLHKHPHKENPPLEDLIVVSTKGLYTSGPQLPRPVSGNQGWSHKHPRLHDTPMPRFGGFVSESQGYASGGYSNGNGRDSQDSLDEFSMRILCATEKIGGLIGKGGVNVRQLEQHTGARIQVEDTGPDADERVILVSSKEGPWHRNSPTIDAIVQLQDKVSTTSEQGTITTRLLVPSGKVGCLLGQGGNIITEMRMRTRADIRVYSKDDKPKYTPSNEELVQISGTNNVVKEALIEIASRLRERTLRGAIPVPHGSFHKVGSLDDFDGRGIPSSAMVGPRNTTNYEHPKRDTGLPYEAREYPGRLTPAGYPGPVGAAGYRSSMSADGYRSPASVSRYPGPSSAAGYPGPPRAAGYRSYMSADGHPSPASVSGYPGPASATRYSDPASATRYPGLASAVRYPGPPNAAGCHNAPISTSYDGSWRSTGYSTMNNSLEIKIPKGAAPTVLGVDGGNISEICQISGARVKLHEPLSGASECVVEIRGSSDQIKAAQSLIQAFIASGGHDVPPPTYAPRSF